MKTLMCGANERQPIIKRISNNNNKDDKNDKEKTRNNLFNQFG
jgi:hypothetical protein